MFPKFDLPPKLFFLQGARLAIGIWLLYIGTMKWVGGADHFVGYIVTEFGKTWSPAPLNTFLAWLIIAAEPLLGLWLLTGFKQRSAWSCTALLMFLLAFGMTMLQKPEVIGNFQWFFLSLGCAALASDSRS